MPEELLGKLSIELLANELELPGKITSGSLDDDKEVFADELEPTDWDIAELDEGSTLSSEDVAEDVVPEDAATEEGIGLGCRGSLDDEPPPQALSMQARLRAHR